MSLQLIVGLRCLLFTLALSGIGLHVSCSFLNSERQSVIHAVELFLKALETRDSDLADDILLPEGVIFSVREESGKKTVRSTTHAQLIDSFAASDEKMLERIRNPKILIHKEIAIVWAKYDFFREDTFSHCGVDAFHLIKTPQGWKISGIIYTVEKTSSS